MMSARYYKYFLIIGFAVMLVGCADVLQESAYDKGNNENNESGTRRYNAYIVNEPVTRTAMGNLSDGKYPVLWSEGDKVLFGSESSSVDNVTCELLEGAGTTKAVFLGRYSSYTADTPLKHITGIYPADGASYYNQSLQWETHGKAEAYPHKLTMTTVLPNIQKYQPNTFAPNVLPMIGQCLNGYDFYYENIGAVLQLPVKGKGKISKIVLTGNDGEVLAGKFTVNFNYRLWYKSSTGSYIQAKDRYVTVDYLDSLITADDKEAACGRLITPVSDKSTGIITIDCGKDGLQLDPTTPTMINIAMLPKTFKKGFSVQFIDYDNGGSFMKSTTESITVKRSYVKTMQEFDYTKPEPLEPANCYVADKAGYYLIPAFCMGNRPKSARLKVDENGLDSINHHKVAADYLWTDTPGAVSQIEYIPGKDGYISFKVNPDANGNAPRGNTVVALYDSVTKEILWSWHIWMSDFKEVATNGSCREGENTADGFSSDEAKDHLIIMDRNLGATSANKEDGVKTYGLYYQMGRKDPFVGANFAGGFEEGTPTTYESHTDKTHQDENIGTYNQFETAAFGDKTNHTEWNKNLTSGWTYKKEFITAIYGYQHPMDFASYWGTKKDTRWTTKELNTVEPFVSNGKHEDFWNRSKTIKDPCPAGWTVLGEDGNLYGSPDKNSATSYTGNGIYGIEAKYTINNVTSTVWWPASGFRSVDGTLGNLGQGGYYWWFDHIDNTHGGHGWWFSKEKNKDEYKAGNGAMTNHACVVRCVKAKQKQKQK